MGTTSSIEWTDATWNIARGCTKVDKDCKFCYMYRDSMNGTRYKARDVVRTKTVFNLPYTLKQPSRIFTSSLTDVFHEAIDSYRDDMWQIIRKCPQHTFQILTKRPERIWDHLPDDFDIHFDHVWLGTSIGHQDGMHRLFDLLRPVIESKSQWDGSRLSYYGIKFLSLEPLHGHIDIPWEQKISGGQKVCQFIDWVIIGGESGNEKGKYRYRPCHIEWIECIISACKFYNIPVFVKQLGTHLSNELGLKDRHGRNMDEWPEHLRIRQFPLPLDSIERCT